MKKLRVFLAAILAAAAVAASFGTAQRVLAFDQSELDTSGVKGYTSSHAGTTISFSTNFRYSASLDTDINGWKVAFCPEDNKTLEGAVATIDIPSENITLNNNDGRFQYGKLNVRDELPHDIPEGNYVKVIFDGAGNMIFDMMSVNTYVDKTFVSVQCDVMNNDGYVYAYVYSDSPALNASVYPTLYAADQTTAITSYNDYTVETNDSGATVHVYRLNKLDESAFTLDSEGHTYVYYSIGTPTVEPTEDSNDGSVGLSRPNGKGLSWTTVFDLNNYIAKYDINVEAVSPFEKNAGAAGGTENPGSTGSSGDTENSESSGDAGNSGNSGSSGDTENSGSTGGAPSPEVPEEEITGGITNEIINESEHVLPNGQTVRMVTANGNSDVYIIGALDVIPAGASFSVDSVEIGESYRMTSEAVEKYIGSGLEFGVYEMDLTAADGTAITQLKDYVNVTLPLSSNITLDEGKTIVVYRYENNGKLTRCNTVVDENMVTFATNHFSFYIMVEQDASAGPAFINKTSPKTADVTMFPIMATAVLGMGMMVVVMKKKNEM